MKRFIALVLALFFATAAVAEAEEASFKFELDKSWGALNQTVKAGESIELIMFSYEGITAWEVTGLPQGLDAIIDEDEHIIAIRHNMDASVKSGDYKYTVTVKDNNSEEHTLSGVITVNNPDATVIKVIENET